MKSAFNIKSKQDLPVLQMSCVANFHSNNLLKKTYKKPLSQKAPYDFLISLTFLKQRHEDNGFPIA